MMRASGRSRLTAGRGRRTRPRWDRRTSRCRAGRRPRRSSRAHGSRPARRRWRLASQCHVERLKLREYQTRARRWNDVADLVGTSRRSSKEHGAVDVAVVPERVQRVGGHRRAVGGDEQARSRGSDRRRAPRRRRGTTPSPARRARSLRTTSRGWSGGRSGRAGAGRARRALEQLPHLCAAARRCAGRTPRGRRGAARRQRARRR